MANTADRFVGTRPYFTPRQSRVPITPPSGSSAANPIIIDDNDTTPTPSRVDPITELYVEALLAEIEARCKAFPIDDERETGACGEGSLN